MKYDYFSITGGSYQFLFWFINHLQFRYLTLFTYPFELSFGFILILPLLANSILKKNCFILPAFVFGGYYLKFIDLFLIAFKGEMMLFFRFLFGDSVWEYLILFTVLYIVINPSHIACLIYICLSLIRFDFQWHIIFFQNFSLRLRLSIFWFSISSFFILRFIFSSCL